MFLIFVLNRPDILPASDLGVRAGLQGPARAGRAAQAARLSRPGRSRGGLTAPIASWYIWKGTRHARSPAPTARVADGTAVARRRPKPQANLHDIRPDLEGRLGDRRLGRAAVSRRRRR